MTSSAACWAAFGRVLAAEYADPGLAEVHRLSVDAFAVQHPGHDSRQAIQSVGLHLTRLYMQLERGLRSSEANAFMLRAARRKAELQLFASPATFEMTVADVAPLAGSIEHEPMVRRWAEAAWAGWADVHSCITKWAETISA